MNSRAVIGAEPGAPTLAIMAARAGHEVRLWSRDADIATAINNDRVILAILLLPSSGWRIRNCCTQRSSRQRDTCSSRCTLACGQRLTDCDAIESATLVDHCQPRERKSRRIPASASPK
jgi:hypothetical protein